MTSSHPVRVASTKDVTEWHLLMDADSRPCVDAPAFISRGGSAEPAPSRPLLPTTRCLLQIWDVGNIRVRQRPRFGNKTDESMRSPALGGIGRGSGEPGAIGFRAEAAQAPARPEEAEAQETERLEDQTYRHREDPKSSSSVYKIMPPKGWVGRPTLRLLG